MDELLHLQDTLNRRTFLKSTGLGFAALATLLTQNGYASMLRDPGQKKRYGGQKAFPNFAPKANRVIYLFQSGAPSHLDLFDYKPGLQVHRAEDLPDSIRMGQRLTGMSSGQAKFPVAPTLFKFNQYGKTGTYLTELMPHLGEVI